MIWVMEFSDQLFFQQNIFLVLPFLVYSLLLSDIFLIIAGPTEPRMASLASRWHRGGSTGDMIWVMEFSYTAAPYIIPTSLF